MNKEFVKYLHGSRKKGRRIRTIFLYFRRHEKYYGFSDLTLLNTIVFSLKDIGLPFSRHEIYSALNEVDKEDYSQAIKYTVRENLLSGAKDKSVFKN